MSVKMVLYCPKCKKKHIDRKEWATTRTHKKHLCEFCGELWRPFDYETVGVRFILPAWLAVVWKALRVVLLLLLIPPVFVTAFIIVSIIFLITQSSEIFTDIVIFFWTGKVNYNMRFANFSERILETLWLIIPWMRNFIMGEPNE